MVGGCIECNLIDVRKSFDSIATKSARFASLHSLEINLLWQRCGGGTDEGINSVKGDFIACAIEESNREGRYLWRNIDMNYFYETTRPLKGRTWFWNWGREGLNLQYSRNANVDNKEIQKWTILVLLSGNYERFADCTFLSKYTVAILKIMPVRRNWSWIP